MKFKEFLDFIYRELNARKMDYFMDCEYQFIICEGESSRVIKKLSLSQRDFNAQDKAYKSFLKSLEKTVRDALNTGMWSVTMRVAIADTFNGRGGNLGFLEMQSPRMADWKVSDSTKNFITKALNQIDGGRGRRECVVKTLRGNTLNRTRNRKVERTAYNSDDMMRASYNLVDQIKAYAKKHQGIQFYQCKPRDMVKVYDYEQSKYVWIDCVGLDSSHYGDQPVFSDSRTGIDYTRDDFNPADVVRLCATFSSMLSVGEGRNTKSRTRYLHKTLEGFNDGDVEEIYDTDANGNQTLVDRRVYGISIMPDPKGNIPLIEEIKSYVRFLKTGQVPRKSNLEPSSTSKQRLAALKAQYGDDWKSHVNSTDVAQPKDSDSLIVTDFSNKRVAMGNLKKLMIAAVKNNVISQEELLEILHPLNDNETADSVRMSILRDNPELADILPVVFGDIDTKELEHGVGSHAHGMDFDDLLDDPSKHDAAARITGDSPKDPETGKRARTGGPGKRLDWEQSSYRAIAEQEANAYISRLTDVTGGKGSTKVVGREEALNKQDATDMIIAIQSDFQGKGSKATGRNFADAWMGDPSREDYGFDTEHAVYGGISVSFGGFARREPELGKSGKPLRGGKVSYNVSGRGANAPDWSCSLSIKIAAPYIGSLDDPQAEHDLIPFCVSVSLGQVNGVQSVGRKKLEEHIDRVFSGLVKTRGRAYGCSLVDNVYNATAMCREVDADKQVEGLKFLTRCACAAFGECIDLVDGIDIDDSASIRNMVNVNVFESRTRKSLRNSNSKRRNEAMVYSRDEDYPIQELIEWVNMNGVPSIESEITASDVRDFRELCADGWVKLNDNYIQQLLRDMSYIKKHTTSRRQFLTPSEKKELRDDMEELFDAFERFDDSIVDDPVAIFIRDNANRGGNGSEMPYYLESSIRNCRNWVQDNKKDNEELSFYATDILDCLDQIEDSFNEKHYSCDASRLGYGDASFEIKDDSSLPKYLDILKGRGKVSMQDFEEMYEEVERIDGTVEAMFDLDLEQIDSLEESLSIDSDLEGLFKDLRDLWLKVIDAIDGFPGHLQNNLRFSWESVNRNSIRRKMNI